MMKKNHAAKRSWRVLALALCLAMLVGLLPTVALADVSSTIKLDNATYYDSGALKSINITYTGWSGTTYNITSRLLLSTVQLNAKTSEKPTHGDYTDLGTYGKVYKTYDALMSSTAATSTFGILNATNAENPGASSSSPKTWTFNFKESDIPLDQNKDYFITVWTNYSSYFFPDSLLCGIRVRDGVVRYAEAYRNVIDESKYGFVENVNTYTVKVTKGNHMTKTTDSGDAEQSGNTGITPVSYTHLLDSRFAAV